ncbi:MAG: ABC transporter permease [Defluviitaleaceae bacterium]|nr:ABC transporter permease [Defluviitaleaceae bacterium]MCL2837089.1 ABC transporter permease [Defluviitaleaceae bacterium]
MAREARASMSITEEFAAKIRKDNQKDKIIRFAPIIVLAVMSLVFSAINGRNFASVSNFTTILNQLAIPLLVALGLTFVIMIGSIDLSINGTVGMSAAFLGVLVMNSRNGMDLGLAGVLLAVLASVAVGMLIGLIHVHLKIPSFMVSFAFMFICRGLGLLSYQGRPPRILDPVLTEIPRMSFLGMPAITWVALSVLLLCIFIQEYTAFGRYIYAVGTDETILHSVGVSVKRVKVMVFTLAGFCFGIAGVLGGIRLGQGDVTVVGTGLMFPAQAAVVVGGTALSGGKGGVINTVVGVFIMTVLFNGLVIMRVNPYIRTGVEGLIILAAVTLTVARGAKVISK